MVTFFKTKMMKNLNNKIFVLFRAISEWLYFWCHIISKILKIKPITFYEYNKYHAFHTNWEMSVSNILVKC